MGFSKLWAPGARLSWPPWKIRGGAKRICGDGCVKDQWVSSPKWLWDHHRKITARASGHLAMPSLDEVPTQVVQLEAMLRFRLEGSFDVMEDALQSGLVNLLSRVRPAHEALQTRSLALRPPTLLSLVESHDVEVTRVQSHHVTRGGDGEEMVGGGGVRPHLVPCEPSHRDAHL